jgi:DNA-binding transcriptional regulator YiaG
MGRETEEKVTVVRWAKRVKAIRKSLDLTQTQFAQRLDVHVSTVCKWEQGLANPQRVWQRALIKLEHAND